MESKGVAIITGAANGIGRAIALALADDGFNVAINDLASNKGKLDTLTQDIVQKGRQVSIIIGDVSQEADVKGMVESTVRDLGGLDVMVANAGIGDQADPIQDIKVEDWDHLYSINIRGVFLCYKYAAQQMIKQGRGGRIIGASAIGGKQGWGYVAPYCSSAFAVRGLTQSAAHDLGPHGITVNAYAPGTIDTAMLSTMGERLGKKRDSPEAHKAEWIKASPVGHLGTPLDVASIVSYLASKEAHFITGQSISVNGGAYFD